MKQIVRKYLQIILRLLVSGLAMYFVFAKIDYASVHELLGRSNLLLLMAGVLFFFLSKVISAYRLNMFFGAEGIHIDQLTNMRLYLLGMFYNLFLPGGIGGDGYKVYYLRKNFNVPVKNCIRAIIFDRVTGLFALMLLCLIFAFFSSPQFIKPWQILLLTAASTTLLYLATYKWFEDYCRILNVTNLQSLSVQLSQVITALVILKAIGEDQQILLYLSVFLVSSIVAVIPFTIGGVGARELTFLFASEIFHLNVEASIALSLLFFIITVVVSFGGILYLIRPGLIRYRPNPV
ncbi:MAG: flippase-like domain-containing protein [Bacteroidales bacterium]|nr:flippase-like domain-containing protein [Bacteroidales bacterium]